MAMKVYSSVNCFNSLSAKGFKNLEMHSYALKFQPRKKFCVISRNSLNPEFSGGRKSSKSNENQSVLSRIFNNGIRIVSGLIFFATFSVATCPYVLSWKPTRNCILQLYNFTIPGSLSVGDVNLGWRKPIRIERISIESPTGENGARLEMLESELALIELIWKWPNFGNISVNNPTANLVPNKEAGFSEIELSLTPLKSLELNNPFAKKNAKAVSSAEMQVEVELNSSHGCVSVKNGRLALPEEVVRAVGKRMVGKISVNNTDLSDIQHMGRTTQGAKFEAEFRSSSMRMSSCGHSFIHQFKPFALVEQPISIEANITNSLSHLILAPIHPMLADLASPDQQQQPSNGHLSIQVLPVGHILPATEYSIDISPIRAAVSKGSMAARLADLVSASRGSMSDMELMETSAIHLLLGSNGSLNCQPVNVLIAGRVHLLGKCKANVKSRSLDSVILIPRDTLQKYFRLNNLPEEFSVQVPILGTIDSPRVDLKSTAAQIVQLTVAAQAKKLGTFVQSLRKST